jgi:protein SCO1/2
MLFKYIISSLLVLLVVFVEAVHFQRQQSGFYDRLPRCYPTGDVFPYKDANGNVTYDSLYHRIADFTLTDQNGKTFTNNLLKGKIYVASFFFATCPSICPKMTSQMLRLQEAFKTDTGVEFLSHTVNPEHDSVTVLKGYEQHNNIDGKRWHLLTGSREALYDLSKQSYYLGVENDSPDNFQHSEKFVLVDNHRVIRGFYNGTDSKAVDKLKEDIKRLLKELHEGIN